MLVIVTIVFVILAFGLVSPYIFEIPKAQMEANYLLTVLATTGALGGIAFALYGWYTARELPKLIDKKVTEKTNEITKRN